MKRDVMLIGLAVFLLCMQSPLWPQGTPGTAKPTENGIEGTWTELCWENEGHVISMLPGEQGMNSPGPPVPLLWKISKSLIEGGPDNRLFPTTRSKYKLHPNGQAGAIDLIHLDKDGKEEGKSQAIYFLKDDYLMICMSRDARPEKFTTSSKPPTTGLFLLHRGKLK